MWPSTAAATSSPSSPIPVAGELEVGTRVRFVFRIKDVDAVRGFRRYFWKATAGED